MRSLKCVLLGGLACLLVPSAFAQPTRLNLDRTAGTARVWLDGETNREYNIEAASDLRPGQWEFLLTTPLLTPPQPWFDSASGGVPRRFYRAVKLEPTAPTPAEEFRLIDHLGRSHSLDYHLDNPAVSAVVLLFTGNGCATVQQMAPTINALTNRFGSVLFWMIDANAADNRSNIAAQATALGLSIPILHDPAQLVARAYQATTTPEAVGLKRHVDEFGQTMWATFYRGAIDDRRGATPLASTQYYLSNALVNLLAARTVAPTRSVPSGCGITFNPRPVASYSADIAPLLQDKCVRCHSPGNIAPFAMTDHETVQPWAAAMRRQVLSGAMPPWHADPYYSRFANDASLSPEQAAKLVQWIEDGAPRGDGPDPLAQTPPPATNYPFAWPASLGEPDYIVTVPAQTISGFGHEPYHYVNVTTTLPSNAWVRAAIILPDNVPVVHHALVYSGSTSTGSGMDGFFAGYVPGYDAVAFPSNTYKLLPAGQQLTFQIHYIRNGRDNTDQTRIGLYLYGSRPAYELKTKSAYNPLFTIPPGARDYQSIAKYPVPPLGNPSSSPTLTRPIRIYEMEPHMHLRGSRFRYDIVYANGTRETILSVPDYDFHWQTLYRLTAPKDVPAGARIECVGAWDNSALNPDNPDPTRSVSFGEQTENEMFIGYFNFVEL